MVAVSDMVNWDDKDAMILLRSANAKMEILVDLEIEIIVSYQLTYNLIIF